MNVLHFGCRYFPYIGGSTLRVARILEAGVRHGLRPVVVTFEPSETGEKSGRPEERDGVLVYRYPSLIHALATAPSIIKKHRIQLIHAHNPRVAAALQVLFPFVPMVVELHSVSPMSPLKKNLVRIVLSRADRVIVLSNSGLPRLASYFGLPESKFVVVPNGIEIDQYRVGTRPIRRVKWLEPGQTIGYIGTFYEWQGVLALVESAPLVLKHYPQARYVLVGDGPAFEDVRAFVASHGLENRVILTGTVSPSEAVSILTALDIVCIPRPSTFATETVTPLKVFEAMAAQRAIVISRVGGLLEVLTPGVDCLGFEPGNVNALAESIMTLLGDSSQREKLGKRAFQRLESWPDWSNVAEQLMEVYRGIRVG